MKTLKQVIINTEYFLQCHGSCSGCFLTEEERQSDNINKDVIQLKLQEIRNSLNANVDHLIIGFGRGNLLNLSENNLLELIKLIHWCEENFTYEKITFEISTSLIGKLDKQIEKAKLLLNGSKNIFFNVVINSEITSPKFWSNFNQFYNATAIIRKGWGMIEDWGDILVLNVNPQKLPDLTLIEQVAKDHQSPININIFPFEINQKIILNSEIKKLNKWLEELWIILSEKDFNVKNYLQDLMKIDFELNPNDLKNYYITSKNSYFFIDKNGIISNGIPSIMGEVDFPRLLEKYDLKPDLFNAYKKMQKNKVCASCDYQKECLVSGAFLNLLSNADRLIDSNHCASGYKELFQLAKSNNKY